MSSKFTTQSKIPDMNSRGDYQQTIPVEGDVLPHEHDQLPPSYEEAAGSSSNSHHPSAGTPPDQAGESPRARTMSGSSSACRSRCGGSIQKPQDAITQGYQPQNPMSAYQDDDAKWDAKLGKPGCCFSESGACCFSKRGACCFSDRGACCFSDREACCFSDRKGCCFSDQGGCCNGNSRGSTGTCC